MVSRTALVTGAEGFVGSYMVPALERRGYDVRRLDIVHGGRQDVRVFCREADSKFDLVVHLAAVVGGRMTIEHDPIALAVDLAIDSDLFSWAVRTRQPRLLYFSSSAAYPYVLQESPRRRRLTETDLSLWDVSTPDLLYGWAKLTGEMLASYASKEGLKTTIVRPFSGYGYDQDIAYPFPAYVERARRRDDPYQVWGDGNQVRDFIHITDVVEGALRAVEVEYPHPVNLCTGRATNFNTLARMMMAEAGYGAPIEHVAGMPVGPQYRVGDPANMQSFFTPTVTLEQGIADALR